MTQEVPPFCKCPPETCARATCFNTNSHQHHEGQIKLAANYLGHFVECFCEQLNSAR